MPLAIIKNNNRPTSYFRVVDLHPNLSSVPYPVRAVAPKLDEKASLEAKKKAAQGAVAQSGRAATALTGYGTEDKLG